MARMRGPDRVRAGLEAASLACPIRTLPDSTRTAVEAAAAVGCSVGEIAKSLVFRAGDRAVVAIMSGDNRLDPATLAAAIGEEVRRADADFVRAATGFAIGGVPPLGTPRPSTCSWTETCSASTRSGPRREVLAACSRSSRHGCVMPAGRR